MYSAVAAACNYSIRGKQKGNNSNLLRHLKQQHKVAKKKGGVGEMVETTKPIFVSFASKITKEGENGETGTLEVFTQIQDCPVTNEELLEIKKIQEEAAGKIDALFKRWQNPGQSRGGE